MARQARIETSGALHHIICPGIERRKIFNDDADRHNFFGASWKYFKRELNALLRLGADTESLF
jgi:hypothetical protein